jgi:hypothetical protein
VSGNVIKRIPDVSNIGIIDAAVLTTKQILSGYLGFAGGATVGVTTPTGTELFAAIPGCAAGDSFEVILNNLAADVLTITGGVDATCLGAGTLAAGKAGKAIFLCTANNAFSFTVLTST